MTVGRTLEDESRDWFILMDLGTLKMTVLLGYSMERRVTVNRTMETKSTVSFFFVDFVTLPMTVMKQIIEFGT